MENNLYQAVKNRMIAEMNLSINNHPTYAGQVKAVAKYHMGRERPQTSVILDNVTSSREHLSPDDCVGDLWSIVSVAKVGDCPGHSIEWVWEDSYNITKYVKKEDVTATLDSSRRFVQLAHFPVAQGLQNPDLATSVGQISISLNGVNFTPKSLNNDTGLIDLGFTVKSEYPHEIYPALRESSSFSIEMIPPTILVSYYYRDIAPQGYYYLELVDDSSFNVTPMLYVEEEVVVKDMEGSVTEAFLDHINVLEDYIITLYTQRTSKSVKIYWERNFDYTIEPTTGKITFLNPNSEFIGAPGKPTTLYASYRWIGDTIGPIAVRPYCVDDTTIKGAIIVFGSRIRKGDKHCIILRSSRERCAQIKGGHYTMSLDWKVSSRDRMTTDELVDHLTSDLWGNRKEHLRSEGLVVEECIATGETEEAYDEATQAMYFQNTISMQLMTEWKKFIPYVENPKKFKYRLEAVSKLSPSYQEIVKEIGKGMNLITDEYSIEYPKASYPYVL